MLFDLPDHDTLYQALVERDDRYDGQAYVGVSTTGVFCRLTCPARKPKSENCTFFDSVGACLEAGYRPCKRCHPLAPVALVDPIIRTFLTALDKRPAYRWSEADVKRMGFDPSTVRRSFRRQFGLTFSGNGHGKGGCVMGLKPCLQVAWLLRHSWKRILNLPVLFAERSQNFWVVHLAIWIRLPCFLQTGIATPLGDMISVSSQTELHLLEFLDRKALKTELNKLDKLTKGRLGPGKTGPGEHIKAELACFFDGRSARFTTPLACHGTPFMRSVWNELRRIPPGVTRSYADIARRIGRPSAARAVARANGANQIALVIPCHRVIGTDGSLTGLWRWPLA